MLEIKDDLFNVDFGNTLNFQLYKRPSREHNSNPLKEESLRKPPKSNYHIRHREKSTHGISSEPLEGEPSYLEISSNLSPSMPTTDICFEPISEPILNSNDPSYALLPESYDDPRNSLRHLKHRSHEGHKGDQEEKRQRI
jgi:hypothetical protein